MKSSIFAAATLAISVAAASGSNADTLAALKKASTAVERISILGDDSDFVFNFLDPTKNQTKGAGGHTVTAAVNTFPALFGAGMAMTIGFMEPCSLNSPHTHPRATEVLIMLNGSITAGFLAENGARFVTANVPTLSATLFPKGSIHFQANLGCEPALFAAALSHEDPGTLQIAQRFFGLPASVVGASLGGIGVEDVASLAKLIPDNLISASAECFTHCGLTPPAPGSQPTKQQQPPSPDSTNTESAPAPSSTTGGSYEGKGSPNNWIGVGQDSTTKPESAPGSAGSGIAKPVVNLVEGAVNSAKGWFAHLDGTKIALIVLAALNVALIIGSVIFCIVRSVRRGRERRSGGMSSMPTVANISAPRPLFTGRASNRGKYAAAEFEMPIDDAASQDAIFPRKFEDPYDKPPSRAPSPLPAAHSGPYRD